MSWVDFFLASKKDIERAIRREKTLPIVANTIGAACTALLCQIVLAASSDSYLNTLNSWPGIRSFFPLGFLLTIVLVVVLVGKWISLLWATVSVAELVRRWKLCRRIAARNS